jgi:hypothetical protein
VMTLDYIFYKHPSDIPPLEYIWPTALLRSFRIGYSV